MVKYSKPVHDPKAPDTGPGTGEGKIMRSLLACTSVPCWLFCALLVCGCATSYTDDDDYADDDFSDDDTEETLSCDRECWFIDGLGSATVAIYCDEACFYVELDVTGGTFSNQGDSWDDCDVDGHPTFTGSIEDIVCTKDDYYMDCHFNFGSSGKISGMSCKTPGHTGQCDDGMPFGVDEC